MRIILARNVNDALSAGLFLLRGEGIIETSRNGDACVMPCPVTTSYKHPWERVLFSPIRDANPFFHLMEALWMLAGHDDLDFPLYFNSKFSAYSDDGISLHGAYGKRWRSWFGYDQLQTVYEELKSNPSTRRAVLTMWDARIDPMKADSGGKDVPCNTQIYFRVNQGALDMTVTCRSNDIYWGAYGANAVHMSVLQELMTRSLGLNIGSYYQISNNYHFYPANLPLSFDLLLRDVDETNLYAGHDICTSPLLAEGENFYGFLSDVAFFVNNPTKKNDSPFLNNVAVPMYAAWNTRKRKNGTGMIEASHIEADDWRIACMAWIIRREQPK